MSLLDITIVITGAIYARVLDKVGCIEIMDGKDVLT